VKTRTRRSTLATLLPGKEKAELTSAVNPVSRGLRGDAEALAKVTEERLLACLVELEIHERDLAVMLVRVPRPAPLSFS
jgi:hypothetical protein